MSDKLLASRWEEFNETHKKVFGTEMKKGKHYFPLRYTLSSSRENNELAEETEEKKNSPSMLPGSLINRVRNSRPISLKTNAFTLLYEHIQEMEKWNSYSQVREDINTILNNRRIREQMETNSIG
jgi:hypothetical protein